MKVNVGLIGRGNWGQKIKGKEEEKCCFNDSLLTYLYM